MSLELEQLDAAAAGTRIRGACRSTWTKQSDGRWTWRTSSRSAVETVEAEARIVHRHWSPLYPESEGPR